MIRYFFAGLMLGVFGILCVVGYQRLVLDDNSESSRLRILPSADYVQKEWQGVSSSTQTHSTQTNRAKVVQATNQNTTDEDQDITNEAQEEATISSYTFVDMVYDPESVSVVYEGSYVSGNDLFVNFEVCLPHGANSNVSTKGLWVRNSKGWHDSVFLTGGGNEISHNGSSVCTRSALTTVFYGAVGSTDNPAESWSGQRLMSDLPRCTGKRTARCLTSQCQTWWFKMLLSQRLRLFVAVSV